MQINIIKDDWKEKYYVNPCDIAEAVNKRYKKEMRKTLEKKLARKKESQKQEEAQTLEEKKM